MMKEFGDKDTNVKHAAVRSEHRHILRIVQKTGMDCYLHNAYFLCALLAYEELEPWYFENYIQLYFAPSKRIRNKYAEEVWLDVYGGWEKPRRWLDIIEYSRSDLEDLSIVAFLETGIDSGQYFHTYIDEFYTVRKGTEHFSHDVFVYGYDRLERKLFVIGYNEKHEFRPYEIEYDVFEQAFASGAELSKQIDDEFGGRSYALGYRCKMDKIREAPSFSINRFLFMLHDYVHAKDTSKEHRDYKSEMYQLEGNIFGLAIYEPILHHLEHARDSGTRLDYRPFHLLYEHKMGLAKRFRYIVQEGYGDAEILEPLAKEMEDLAEAFHMLRLLALRYMFTMDAKLAARIRDTSEQLVQREKTAVEAFYQALVII